jgi:hypothetical protein
MNVEIGTEVAYFPAKEYIMGFSLQIQMKHLRFLNMPVDFSGSFDIPDVTSEKPDDISGTFWIYLTSLPAVLSRYTRRRSGYTSVMLC